MAGSFIRVTAKESADFASASAFSLPRIPTWHCLDTPRCTLLRVCLDTPRCIAHCCECVLTHLAVHCCECVLTHLAVHCHECVKQVALRNLSRAELNMLCAVKMLVLQSCQFCLTEAVHLHNVDSSICLQELVQVQVQDRRDDRPSDTCHTELFHLLADILHSSPDGPSTRQTTDTCHTKLFHLLAVYARHTHEKRVNILKKNSQETQLLLTGCTQHPITVVPVEQNTCELHPAL